MSYVIAVAGKGGTGKTTTSSLIVRFLLKNTKKPILAVDADPNSNFAESIGIKVENTIGNVLNELLRDKGAIPQGMTKQSFLELKLHQILKEGKDIDALVMGCPEGPGCYCAANSILKSYFEDLAENYRYVVYDNEAGMEHFSRKTNTHIDLLLFCSNYSLKGLKTVRRLSDIVNDLGLKVKDRFILVNLTPLELDEDFMSEVKKINIPYLGNVSTDKLIEDFDLKGIPLIDLPDSSSTVKSIDRMLRQVIQ